MEEASKGSSDILITSEVAVKLKSRNPHHYFSAVTDLGFDAIWISPVVENYEGGYHGYYASDLYKINSHFGTRQDLLDLVNECHQRNIWVMVDVVANHVGPVGEDYAQVKQFNLPEHYHEFCTISGEDYWGDNQWRIEVNSFVSLRETSD